MPNGMVVWESMMEAARCLYPFLTSIIYLGGFADDSLGCSSLHLVSSIIATMGD